MCRKPAGLLKANTFQLANLMTYCMAVEQLAAAHPATNVQDTAWAEPTVFVALDYHGH